MDNSTFSYTSSSPLSESYFNVSGLGNNVSQTFGLPRALVYPTSYRIVGTLLFLIIFALGFIGNIIICVVVKQSRSLHTPTYYYLVSLRIQH